jgi:hypothetical protein
VKIAKYQNTALPQTTRLYGRKSACEHKCIVTCARQYSRRASFHDGNH